MFQRIYPRKSSDTSIVGLFEELGELGEAVRVGQLHPKYFLGEAADTFSYIMAIANEHQLRVREETGETFSFEREFLRRYPGLCTQCGYKICVCPAVPEATVGRLAKEISISKDERPFFDDLESFTEEGKQVAQQVLRLQVGFGELAEQIPLDRGAANHSLVLLSFGIAEALEANDPLLARSIRAEALNIGIKAQSPGTPRQPIETQTLLRNLADAWKRLTISQKGRINTEGALVRDFVKILDYGQSAPMKLERS